MKKAYVWKARPTADSATVYTRWILNYENYELEEDELHFNLKPGDAHLIYIRLCNKSSGNLKSGHNTLRDAC